MLDACTRRWVGRGTPVEEVRDRLAFPHTSLARDTVVVVDAGEVVGFGHVWPAGEDELRCFARTHPDQRGRGIAGALQRGLVARAEEIARAAAGPLILTTTTWPADPTAPPLLEGLGYRATRYVQRMELDLAEEPSAPAPAPPGLSIRGYLPTDDGALFAAYVEAFADHWGERGIDEATWWHDRRDALAAGFAPELWLVAEDGDEIAGFLTARIREDDAGCRYGYVGDLGVRPPWRGRGLGEALLTHAVDGFGRLGLGRVDLDVDTENTSGAIRLYLKIGMRHRPLFTIWSRSLAS